MKKARTHPPYQEPTPEPWHTRTLPRPYWINQAGVCAMCLNRDAWVSIMGIAICANCHIPAREDAVDHRLTDEEYTQLLQGDLAWTPRA